MQVTLEEKLGNAAKRGLLSLGFVEETAEKYAPWASMAAQFIPGVGEGVGVDNTRDAIEDERYGDAAIEGGLTLLGAVPIVGDFAAAAIKGIRKAPTSLLDDAIDAVKKVEFDEAAWLKANPRPHEGIRTIDMSDEQKKSYNVWKTRKSTAKNKDKRDKYNREYEQTARSRPEGFRDRQNERINNKYRDDEEFKKRKLEVARESYANNPEVRADTLARRNKRRAAQIQRTPTWADPDRINEIYRTAADVSAETGIPHHVDHVMPLQGKNVSGLHHQDNLLVVPGAENLSKSNKFEPGDLPPRAGIRKSRAYLKKIRAAQDAARQQ